MSFFYSANGECNSISIENFGNEEKTENNLKMITPATLFNFYDAEINNKNIVIVNTLDNPYFIVKKPYKNEYLEIYNNGNDFMNKPINNNIELIILYCANYTCSAAKNYAKKLLEKFSDYTGKVVLYEGGLLEWSNMSLNYSNYGIFNTETNKLLNNEELYDVNINFSHWLESSHTGFPKIVYDHVGNSNFYKNLDKVKNNIITTKLLENKVCVVTGATSGLGLATLKKMLDNGAKHVTGTYYNNDTRANQVENELVEKYGNTRVKILKADARTTEGNRKTFDPEERKKYLPAELIPVDCVDINAGIFGPANIHKKHIFNIKDEDYDKVMKLNMRGYYLGFKHFSKQAIQNNVKDAAIVCIKSIYGSTGSLFSNTAYQISKHGTMGLVRQSAIEMARPNKKLGLIHPIRVNAVSPTFTDTALTRPLLKYNKVNDTIANSNTTGELAKKEDVANAVVFLCSKLSGSITGVDLPVDCGVLAESVPTYPEVRKLNDEDEIDVLSCCGDTV